MLERAARRLHIWLLVGQQLVIELENDERSDAAMNDERTASASADADGDVICYYPHYLCPRSYMCILSFLSIKRSILNY